MRLKFLCENHRAQLSQSPKQAINCWQDGYEVGYILHEEQKWEKAIPHLGCAWETAEIILTTRAMEASDAGEIFSQSTILLADTLAQLDYDEQFFEITLLSVERLQKELISSTQKQLWVYNNLEKITDVMNSSSFISKENKFSPSQNPHILTNRSTLH